MYIQVSDVSQKLEKQAVIIIHKSSVIWLMWATE